MSLSTDIQTIILRFRNLVCSDTIMQHKSIIGEILRLICRDEGIEPQSAVYVGDSLTKDIYMARQANICSVQVKYSDRDIDLYQKLVNISHWTDSDFAREKELKEICAASGIKADYEITSFSQLLDIIPVKEKG
jgi:FMN phosphatase YigB (HAD superfamily)